ncbi:hypothetical protein JQC92_22175 [Shewanella sp. 202IG2-18]|uniref:DUF1016 N-terminal domain-containing protein n=1 Tax=Parashewanella hymeniacidonis TaxID=2807618 RepID=UPI00196175CA|nr:DUF1016 N-terminal domain-containing protein [Parashewanella hymeniacidonis]MBM7074683.1 hypothetical protein [Parashewanella hymeniacidonis]
MSTPSSQTQHFELLEDIRSVLLESRTQTSRAINSVIVQTYWQIGQMIVEKEQNDKTSTEYGKGHLKSISSALTEEFGKGFDERNLRNMRKFYVTFPNWNAVRSELAWTHYRILIRIDNSLARDWYLKEAVEQNWSARALERQINALYYERLLATQHNKQDIRPIENEAKKKTTELAVAPQDYLRDPYIFDFLGLPSNSFQES